MEIFEHPPTRPDVPPPRHPSPTAQRPRIAPPAEQRPPVEEPGARVPATAPGEEN